MTIRRVFLDWHGAALAAATDYLFTHYHSNGILDLERVIIAVPGGRAGRRLLEILVEKSEEQHCALFPPRIITVGRLPELLYRAKKPFASNLVQQLSWIKAMREINVELLKQVTPAFPEDDDLLGWLSLSSMLGQLHRELAAETLKFDTVAKLGSKIEGFREKKRWEVLGDIQQHYLDILDSLDLWDLQTARLYALEHKEYHSDADIFLLGTVDLNLTQKQMLDQVADRVTALVFAPENLANHFDEHGCIHSDAWLLEKIALKAEQIQVVDDPSDQAEAVVTSLAALGGRFSSEQITIGVPDELLVPYIEQHLKQCAVPTRYGVGKPLTQSAPYRLLVVAAEYLETPKFSAFAALVRHPSIQDWLTRQNIHGDWLSEMDNYYTDHIPWILGKQWSGNEDKISSLKQVHKAIEELLKGLKGNTRPMNAWGKPIIDFLVEVFGSTLLDPNSTTDRTILASCEQIHGVLQEHMAIHDSLTPTVEIFTAFQLLLRELDGVTIPPPPDRKAIEMLGWLELPLDDAPVLIVSGFNEGRVPSSNNEDLFLPNELRRALGVEDNDCRYARDAYALSMLAASRREIKFIVGRRTAEGDPLVPSRLLFACDDEILAKRVLELFPADELRSNKQISFGTLRPGQEQSLFQVPKPRPLAKPVTSMRVTEFKDYLACPYRYYLKHIIKLEALTDDADELDGAEFGSLAHHVLKEFGLSPFASSTDAEEIERWLNHALNTSLHDKYGEEPLPAIQVQIEQLRLRLRAFAKWQADWASQGWRIEHVEVSPEHGKAFLTVDDQPMFLRGRVDRIDKHQSTGKYIVFDYKTSDTSNEPKRTHQNKDQWIDLQLPLYRHLVKGLGIEKSELAYIVLPKDTSKTGHLIAGWTEDELNSADSAAEDVIRKVRAEEFPMAKTPPKYSEEFSAICQDRWLGVPALAEDAQGGSVL